MLILAMLGAAQAQITRLLRENIGLYDESGTLIRRVPRQEAPKLPLPIVGRNPSGQIGVRWSGQVVYLRNSEVEAKGLTDECAALSSAARSSGRAVSASEGIASGMSGSSAPCVR